MFGISVCMRGRWREEEEKEKEEKERRKRERGREREREREEGKERERNTHVQHIARSHTVHAEGEIVAHKLTTAVVSGRRGIYIYIYVCVWI